MEKTATWLTQTQLTQHGGRHADTDTPDTADMVDTDMDDAAEIWTRATLHGTERLHLRHRTSKTISLLTQTKSSVHAATL